MEPAPYLPVQTRKSAFFAATKELGMSTESNIPPLPHERGSEHSFARTLLPGAIALGVAAAALSLLEAKSGGVSSGLRRARSGAGEALDYLGDTAHEWWDEAGAGAAHASHSAKDNLLKAGAKAAGLVGVLEALGGGRLSTGSARALKLMALKKAAQYASTAGKRGGRFVKNHPKLSAAGSYGAVKARSLGHDAADRWDEWQHRLTGRPRRRKQEDHTAANVVTGLAVLGLGAGALYLFSTSPRGQRAWTTTQRSTAHGIKRARSEAERFGGTLSEGFSSIVDRGRSAVERTRSEAGKDETRNDEQIVSEVRRAVHERLGSLKSPVDVQVSSRDGHVTVSGKLDESSREKARAAATTVPGVRDVSLMDA